jgi:hypothetical protein
LARFNAKKNGLSGKVTVENSEARVLLLNYASRERFDAVDLEQVAEYKDKIGIRLFQSVNP